VNQGGKRGHGDYQANDQSSSAGEDQQHNQDCAPVGLLLLPLLEISSLAPKLLTEAIVAPAGHAHTAEVLRHDLLLHQLLAQCLIVPRPFLWSGQRSPGEIQQLGALLCPGSIPDRHPIRMRPLHCSPVCAGDIPRGGGIGDPEQFVVIDLFSV